MYASKKAYFVSGYAENLQGTLRTVCNEFNPNMIFLFDRSKYITYTEQKCKLQYDHSPPLSFQIRVPVEEWWRFLAQNKNQPGIVDLFD